MLSARRRRFAGGPISRLSRCPGSRAHRSALGTVSRPAFRRARWTRNLWYWLRGCSRRSFRPGGKQSRLIVVWVLQAKLMPGSLGSAASAGTNYRHWIWCSAWWSWGLRR